MARSAEPLVLAVLVAASLVVAAPAAQAQAGSTGPRSHGVRAEIASRPAHPVERRRIARAVRASKLTQGVRGKFDVRRVRISTVDEHWGKALARPKPRYRDQFDTATVVVRRTHGRWSVKTLGTADVGCVIPRRAVRSDLELDCSG